MEQAQRYSDAITMPIAIRARYLSSNGAAVITPTHQVKDSA